MRTVLVASCSPTCLLLDIAQKPHASVQSDNMGANQNAKLMIPPLSGKLHLRQTIFRGINWKLSLSIEHTTLNFEIVQNSMETISSKLSPGQLLLSSLAAVSQSLNPQLLA